MNAIRDSFDRFCDDLCEELLSGLSIEQCFDYECVSTLFKRCLFRTQTRLTIDSNNDNFPDLRGDNLMFKLKESLNNNRSDILKLVLKKCVAITDIEIEWNSLDFISDEMIANIIDYCADLKAICIKMSVQSVSRRMWQLFGEKFGQSLRSISFYYIDKDCIQTLFRLTPRVIECKGIALNHYLSDDKSVTLLPKLKSIIASFDSIADFKLFADQYAKRVEKIDFTYSEFDVSMLSQLSRFERLKVLKIGHIMCSDKIMNKALNMLAEKCLHLREFYLRGFTNNDETEYNYVYKFRHRFESLKELNIFYVENSGLTRDLQYLSSCPHLVDLHLESGDHEVVNFNAVHSFPPTLRSIHLNFCNAVIDDHILIALNILDLISITIISKNLNITDTAIRDFITKRTQLRTIEFLVLENLSETTVETFISHARNNPKYNHSFNAILWDKDIERKEKRIRADVPKNLKLNISYRNVM